MVHLKAILNPWNTGCAEVQSQSFRPVEGPRLNLRYMSLKQLLKSYNTFKVTSILCPKVLLHPRWISDTDSVPLKSLQLNVSIPVSGTSNLLACC